MTGKDPGELTLEQLRSERAELQAEEDAVSFVRRLAQGRLDVVHAEVRRRRGQAADADLSAELPDILGRQVAAGSARPPRSTAAPADHPLVDELDHLCAELGFHELSSLDDAALGRLVEGLADFERRRSQERSRLFQRIDDLTGELVRRYRDGAASVDSLLGD
jgi:hypothetical protein